MTYLVVSNFLIRIFFFPFCKYLYIEQAKHRNPQLELPPPTKEMTMSAVEKAMAAVCGGNVSALLALLQSGISVNHVCEQRTNSTMLHMAAYCGQVGLTKCPSFSILHILFHFSLLLWHRC